MGRVGRSEELARITAFMGSGGRSGLWGAEMLYGGKTAAAVQSMAECQPKQA